MRKIYIIAHSIFLAFAIVAGFLRDFETMRYAVILMTLYQILVSLEYKK